MFKRILPIIEFTEKILIHVHVCNLLKLLRFHWSVHTQVFQTFHSEALGSNTDSTDTF